MIKFEKITAGMRLADIHKTKMGNTTMSRDGLWWVQVKSVDLDLNGAIVSWNGNRDEFWPKRRLEKPYVETSPTVKKLLEKQQRGGIF